MINPKLIHPRKVLLFRRSETDVDPEFGPTGKITWQEPIELRGQVAYSHFQALNPTGSGNNPVSDGHIVFYNEDWVAAGGQVNDELEIEEDFTFKSRLKITEIRPAAHYHGKNWHVHVYFERMRQLVRE